MEPDLDLLALHGLRLKGFAPTDAVAEFYGLDVGRLGERYRALAEQGYVRARGDDGSRWALTPTGRAEGERLLHAELEASGQRPAIEAAYQRFLPLNPQVLAVCVAWQVTDPATATLNDHTDPAYDAAVIDDLAALDAQARPLMIGLAGALGRYAPFPSGFAAALAEVKAGNYRWFADPQVASYHSLWFELHEDLLATLGLDRPSEAASAPR